VIKHNGPVTAKLDRPSWKAISEYDADYGLRLDTWASAEAQVAAIADDIAYNNHDVDDGAAAGVFSLDDLKSIPLIGPQVIAVRKEFPGLEERLIRLEAVRRMIGVMVDDVLAETARRVKAGKVASPEDVRMLGHALIDFSPPMLEDLSRLRHFLMEQMYRHWKVNRTRSQARRILGEMFKLFMDEPEVLPTEWFARSQNRDDFGRARVVCDYIAGMTDRFAIEEHRKLFHLDVWN
jgi:dGTPase